MTFAVRPIGLVKSAFVWRPTISADVTNWVLYSQAIAAGWDGITPLDAIVTVSSGIVLSANSTSLYGFDTGIGFTAGTTLGLIMPGYVCGMGGVGGNGAIGSPTAGGGGGPALRAQHAITIDATGGVIAGGGGGGGGGGGTSCWRGGVYGCCCTVCTLEALLSNSRTIFSKASRIPSMSSFLANPLTFLRLYSAQRLF